MDDTIAGLDQCFRRNFKEYFFGISCRENVSLQGRKGLNRISEQSLQIKRMKDFLPSCRLANVIGKNPAVELMVGQGSWKDVHRHEGSVIVNEEKRSSRSVFLWFSSRSDSKIHDLTPRLS